MQMRNVHMMHMSPFRDVIFMMQMSHAGMQMQSLSMMVLAHIFNRDANVPLQRWRCKCLAMQMPSNGYVMMQMLLVRMSWYKCPIVGMPWCKCPCRYAMNVNAHLDMQWMQIPTWVCNECECLFESMPWCERPLGSMWCVQIASA